MAMQTSPRAVARAIALLFLLTIIGGVFAQGLVAERLINFHDAAATADNILGHRGLFQIGFTVYLIEMASNVATAALWYVLLRPVSRPVALTAAFLDLTACIVKTCARVLFIAPLWVLGSNASNLANQALHGFSSEQLQSMALVLLRANDTGAATAMAFFGFSGVLNGYLIFRSTFLPRWLGVLAMICGVCWLLFLYPPLGRSTFGITAIFGLLVSVVMIVWLLVKGVDVAKWNEKVSVN
jgi:hypothetical protein